jgi:hypothetical protein
LPWPEAAFAVYSIGWMPMEVASEGDRGTHETPALNFQMVFWCPCRQLGGEL